MSILETIWRSNNPQNFDGDEDVKKIKHKCFSILKNELEYEFRKIFDDPVSRNLEIEKIVEFYRNKKTD